MTIEITGQNIIAGQVVANGAGTFQAVNPATSKTTSYTFHEATFKSVDVAATAAAEAFDVLRNTSAEQRAIFLETIAAEIEALGDTLLEAANEETALGLPRLTGERGRTTGQLRAFATLLREGSFVDAIIDTAQLDRQPTPRSDIRRMSFPIGVVAIFTPNNFPFAFGVLGGDTASALAAGCPVIVKGHPSHPASNELFAIAINRAIAKTGFPAGTFSLLQGSGIDIGQYLVKQAVLRAVAFTGSLKGGRAIFDTAAYRPHPIPVFAEMGSINPVALLPKAILQGGDSLADNLVNSVTLGSGQFCTNPGLIFLLDNADSNAFIETVSEKMQAKQAGTLLNSGVKQYLEANVSTTMGKDSVQIKTGGSIVEDARICYENTVMQTSAQAFIDDADLQREHFGPVTLFVLCQSLDEMKAAFQTLEGNLTATIHAADDELKTATKLFDVLREKAGRLLLNGFPTGVEVVQSMVHGGPYPATTASGTSSVGMTAIRRFLRPIAFQNMPDSMLPEAIQNANPLNIWRIVDGEYTKDSL
ncbi:MAG: aldehyde dehydrogenase (NADP(+)) [Anaerolineae bacterium]|nr:aldehyde dehydrogenase (NADP(+)) [Anaerolineae bacterium]